MLQSITCPACHHVFEPTAALRAELQAQADRTLADERARLQGDLRAREAELLRQQREFEARAEALALENERKLADERGKIREAAEKAAEERAARRAEELVSAKDAELRTALESKQAAEKKAAEAAAKEADLLRLQRELEARAEAQALEVERKLTDERAKIREEAEKTAEERASLRLRAELDQAKLANSDSLEKIAGLQRKIEELNQRAQQGSMQLQGEAQEVLLRAVLEDAFRFDTFADVPKGVHGADLVQGLRDELARDAGKVLWESKRTKNWSNDWLPKLRDDQRACGADVAVLVTQALPAGCEDFALIDEVWVCSWRVVVPFAGVLRRGLLDLAQARQSAEGRAEKIQLLYDYLSGGQFRSRLHGVLEAFQQLQADLQAERRVILSQWKKRERQLERALVNLTGLYGDLRGLGDDRVARIDALEPTALLTVAAVRADDADLGDDPDGGLPGDGEGDDDESGERAPAPGDATVELLFGLVPEEGNVGNKTLRERFRDAVLIREERAPSDDEFERAKRVLVAQGRLVKGGGRGGSVARAR